MVPYLIPFSLTCIIYEYDFRFIKKEFMKRLIFSIVLSIVFFPLLASGSNSLLTGYRSIVIQLHDGEEITVGIKPTMKIYLSSNGLNVEGEDLNIILPIANLISISKGDRQAGKDNSGVGEIEFQPLFYVEDNTLRIESQGECDFAVFTSDGRCLDIRKVNQSFAYSLNELAPGLYVFHIGQQSVKLMISAK